MMSLRHLLILVLLAASVLAGCQSKPVAYTKEGVIVRAPDFEGRLDGALARAARARLGNNAVKEIEGTSGSIGVDSPDKVGGLPGDREVVSLLSDDTFRAVLLETDEAKAAEALREAGVGVVVVQWRLKSSVDRGQRVISKLYHHDGLEWFALQRVTDNLLIYRVLENPVVFPPELASLMVAAIRHTLKTGELPKLPDVSVPGGRWEFMVTIRGQGRELAVGLSRTRDLTSAVAELARDLERVHRRYSEWHGFPPLKDHIDDLSVEIHRITERAHVEPRGQQDLEDLFELGIDGAVIRDFANRKAGMLPGSASYTRSLRRADQFLRHIASFHHMSTQRPWRDNRVALEMTRAHSYREVPGKGLVYLYRGVPPVPVDLVTLENIEKSIVAAGEWYLANLLPDGQVIYKQWPSENRISNEYNIVRHTLATWNLAQAWRIDPRPEFIEGAIRAQDYTLKYLETEGDMAFVSFNNNQKLGTVVVALLGMMEVARITGDRSNDDLMRKFAEFTLFMQEPDGRFKGYHVEEDHPYSDMVNDIVPGQAALALVELSQYLDEPSYLETLPAYWKYYMDWFAPRVTKKRTDAPWPTHVYDNATRLELVQFGPWTVMAADAYHRVTGDEDVAKFGLEIGRWMIDTYQWSSDRAPFPDYVGGYYKLPYELPAMQAFCYGEGTAAAYQLALRAAPEEAPYFERATRETIRFAFQMQYDELSTYAFTRPELVNGGIRYAMNETKVRVDYVHHGLSNMYIYLMAAREDPALPEGVKSSKPRLVDILAQAGAAPEASEEAR